MDWYWWLVILIIGVPISFGIIDYFFDQILNLIHIIFYWILSLFGKKRKKKKSYVYDPKKKKKDSSSSKNE